jgi:hypothetical protein
MDKIPEKGIEIVEDPSVVIIEKGFLNDYFNKKPFPNPSKKSKKSNPSNPTYNPTPKPILCPFIFTHIHSLILKNHQKFITTHSAYPPFSPSLQSLAKEFSLFLFRNINHYVTKKEGRKQAEKLALVNYNMGVKLFLRRDAGRGTGAWVSVWKGFGERFIGRGEHSAVREWFWKEFDGEMVEGYGIEYEKKEVGVKKNVEIKEEVAD